MTAVELRVAGIPTEWRKWLQWRWPIGHGQLASAKIQNGFLLWGE